MRSSSHVVQPSSPIGLLLVVAAVAACNFPRPMDVPGDDASPGDDAPNDASIGDDAPLPDAPPVGLAIRVAGTGDDANDGIAAPVKTLKRAIGLAAANDEVTHIILAAGRYASASGETFPYSVPTNVTLVGPAGGGAILAGSNTEPGIVVGAGTLQDLELEGFSVAVTATGVAHLSKLRIRTGTLAVRAETAARLTIDNLDITGTAAACAKGISLGGAAQAVVAALATRSLGMTLDASGQSSADVANANVSGDRSCTGPVLRTTSSGTFALKDSLVDNGDVGAQFFKVDGQAAPRVTFANAVLRNLKTNAITGGDDVTFTMTGGELSNNARGGFEGGGGFYTFTNVLIQGNATFGIYHIGNSAISPTLPGLKLRGCSVTGTPAAVYLDDGTVADLGTVASPGNNTFLSIQSVGLYIGGSPAPRIDAVGNTWRPRVQGADAAGKYPPSTPPITVPVPSTTSANYAIERAGISLYL